MLNNEFNNAAQEQPVAEIVAAAEAATPESTQSTEAEEVKAEIAEIPAKTEKIKSEASKSAVIETPSIVADNSLVVCSGLRRRFGIVKALDGVNLAIPSGKIVGLLGPNGAGKTTLIKIINGLLQPDEGVVTIGGYTPGVESKKIISYLPDRMYFADWMKVGDMIDFFGDFYEDFDKDKAAEMCKTLGLDRKMRIKSLSKGTREKMQLMVVMSRKAKLYVLDEPIAGVDPAAREFILHTILTNYNEGGTVLLSTHLISEVEEVLDEAIFIYNGQVVLHDTVDNIRVRENKSVDALFRDMFRANYSLLGGVR